MKLIDRIHSETELKSVRAQIDRVIQKRLGSALSQRKLDEFVADFIGAKDFNTAMGLVRMAESIPQGVEVHKSMKPAHSSMANAEENIEGWYRIMLAIEKQGYATGDDIQEMLDDTVFDFVGTSQWISDNVNNQGWEAQIRAIAAEMCLSQLLFRASELTGITEDDLRRCVAEAAAEMANGGRIKDEFDVRSHIGY